ncbi:MAG: cupin domain-containing protein [Solirubrobacteraceae bacterium]
MKLPNLHESPSRELAFGHIKGVWRDLGREAGTRTVGLRRIEVAAGHFSTPAHEHGADEEIFFVLSGSGVVWEEGKTCEVRGGDCIVHRPLRGAHTLRAADDGLDVLVFGERRDPRLTALPRIGIAWSFPRWVELAGGDSPFVREAAAGAPECPPPAAERPRNVVALADAPTAFGGAARLLGRGAGARATGLNHVTLPPGGLGAPAHCHSEEEELFVVLDGAGTLLLWPRGGGAESRPEEHPLRAGDVASRPAATGVAHALRAGEQGLTYLAYGTRAPGDMCFYPETGRVSLRGLGIALRSPEIEPLP